MKLRTSETVELAVRDGRQRSVSRPVQGRFEVFACALSPNEKGGKALTPKLQAQSSVLFLTVAVFFTLVTALSGQSLHKNSRSASLSVAGSASTATITSSAVWQLAPGFLHSAQLACDHIAVKTRSKCFINRMVRAQAPSAAVQFSRRLLLANGGEFGVMARFQRIGPVDMAKVVYPLRADKTANWALLLVNGDPQILDVDDLQRLDMQELKWRYPKILQLGGGGRGGTMWERTRRRQDGGVTFIVPYWPIRQSPNSPQMSSADFEWNFDPAGKFLGTRFVGSIGPLPI
jgi:hypothetical protein